MSTSSDTLILSKEHLLLLSILRSYVSPEAISDVRSQAASNPDWEALNALADHHNVRLLVSHLMTTSDAAELVPPHIHRAYKMNLYAAVRNHLDYSEWFRQVYAIIRSARITPILLKGLALSEKLYPAPHLRPSVDLDILVRKEDLVTAGLALASSGYLLKDALPAPTGELSHIDLSPLNTGGVTTHPEERTRFHEQHLVYERTDGRFTRLVEMHWKPAPGRLAILDEEYLWSHLVEMNLAGVDVLVSDTTNQVLLVLLHAIQHGWGEGSLRGMLDLTLLINHMDSREWERLAQVISAQPCKGYAYHMLRWVRDFLGARVPEHVLSTTRPSPYESWYARPPRNFGEVVALRDFRTLRNKLSEVQQEIRGYPSFLDRARFLVGIPFPPIDTFTQRIGTPAKIREALFRPAMILWRWAHSHSRQRDQNATFIGITGDRQVYINGVKDRTKVDVSDRYWLFGMLDRCNRFASGLRNRRGVRSGIGKVLNFGCARSFDILTFASLACKRLTTRVRINQVAQRVTSNTNGDFDKTARLNAYVFATVAYSRAVSWLKPVDVLRLGYGDCKCQALLLRELLAIAGVHGRLVVGAAGHRNGLPRVHAWVEFVNDGQAYVCDPTLSATPIRFDEYADRMGGLIEVTEEYLLKRPDLRKKLGVGIQTGSEEVIADGKNNGEI